MTIRYGNLRLTKRERTLLRAAEDALYWLNQLQGDLSGHYGGEQKAIRMLNQALSVYRRNEANR